MMGQISLIKSAKAFVEFNMSDNNMFDEAFPEDKQIGGSHYKQFLIHPWTFKRKNGVKHFQGKGKKKGWGV